MFFSGGDDVVHWLLDANVDDLVAVVCEDDIDQVLTDVVHIASNSCKHDGALAGLGTLFHVGFQECHCTLHNLGGLQDERQLHLALAEALTNYLHTLKQVIIDDIQWLDAITPGLIKVLL